MSDWPLPSARPAPSVISTASPECDFWHASNMAQGAPSSAVWPAASRAIAVSFTLQKAVMVTQLMVINGTAVSGNIDVGLYDNGLTKIISSGTTAQAGVSLPQFFDIADTSIGPGRYYVAVALDNGVGTVMRWGSAVAYQRVGGLLQMAAAFVLPATLTPATVTSTVIPLVGLVCGKAL